MCDPPRLSCVRQLSEESSLFHTGLRLETAAAISDLGVGGQSPFQSLV